MIGANTEEPYSFAMMDNDFPVTGSGGYQFHVSVAPVQWEESYFGIYVNLSEANCAETWTPFAMDVLYITPEQDIVGNQAQTNNPSAGVELNAYSATEFEHRSNYYIFSDMTLEERQIIETIGNSAISNDISILYSLLDSSKNDAFFITRQLNRILSKPLSWKREMLTHSSDRPIYISSGRL